jgi:outer membrane autotransporter protein
VFFAVMLGPQFDAEAQVLSEVVTGAVANGCAGLSGATVALEPPKYGPNLARLCPFIPPGGGSGIVVIGFAGGESSASTLVSETGQDLTSEERRVLERLRKKRSDSFSASPSASSDTAFGLAGLGLFISTEYEAFDKDITRFESGYTSSTWSGTAGVDYVFAEWAIAGIAFSYSSVAGTFAQRGGDFDTDSIGGLLYATFLPVRNLFVDVVGGYTRKHYSTNRAVSYSETNFLNNGTSFLTSATGTASGETDGDEYHARLNFGYDFVFRRFTFGPRLGVNYRYTTIDSFSEKGKNAVICDPVCSQASGTGLELSYTKQHETSLTTVAGLFGSVAFSTPFGVVVPQATFEYVHEFADDQRTIHFSFAEDLSREKFRFQNDPPDRDYFNIGAGVVFVMPGGFSPFVNYRTLLGYKDHSSHTVTAGLRFAF